jgi:hypothetical protein
MYFCMILVLACVATASQQVYNQLYLNPFYRSSTTANTNYTYTVSISPPLGVESVQSAILSFDVYLTPTVVFSLWVNDEKCNTVDFTVSTTYSGSAQGRIYFDCTNVITSAGIYTVKMSATKNTGSVVGWLGVTYSDIPLGELTVHGTEYTNTQEVKVWLQLVNSTGQAVSNGICYVDIYTPDNTEYIEYAKMQNMNHDGIFYYDMQAPLSEGVYPVIARCFYTATQTDNFAQAYSIQFGSYDSGTLANTQTIDGNFIRFKETAVNPVRNISAVLNFTRVCANISEDLLTGITIRTVVKFDSVVNDDITLSVWNYSSGLWIDLPNIVLEGNAFRDVSNTFTIANVTKAGFITNASGLRLRYKDTSLVDGATSNLDIEFADVYCDQFSDPVWHESMGSSELHISSGTQEPFYVETFCGSNEEDKDNSDCAEFRNDTNYWNYTWGFIYDNITFINSYNTDIDSHYEYITGDGQDCTGIIEIIEERNGTITDITNVTLFRGGDVENCILSIPVLFGEDEYSFTVTVTMDNYMKWEAERIDDYILYLEPTVIDYCYSISTLYMIPYDVPIYGIDVGTLYGSMPDFLACYRLMDDIYWFDYYYSASESVTIQGEYEGYLHEMRFYYPEIKEYSQLIIQQEMISCLRNGSCTGWWINNTLSNISLDYDSIYTLLQDIIDDQSALNATLYMVYADQTAWLSLLNSSIVQMNQGIATNFSIVEAQMAWIINNQSYWFPYLDTALSLLPEMIWQYPTRNLSFIDWGTGAQYVWNASTRELTYYNQSIAQSVADCLNTGICAGWWLYDHLVNLSDQTAEMYGLVQYINGSESYWFVNISTDLNLARSENLLYFQSLNETLVAGISNILGNMTTGTQQILDFLDSLNQSVEDIKFNITYYFPLFDGLLINITNNQQYYYPLFNALLYNILANQTASFAEFHDSLVSIMQNQSYYYPMFAGNFSNLTANEMLIISLLYAMGGAGYGNFTVADCQAVPTDITCNEIVRYSCNITGSGIITSVVYTIGGVNYAPTANGSTYYTDLNYTGGYQLPQLYSWTNVAVTDSHSDTSNFAQSIDVAYVCINLDNQLYCYHNEEPFLKQKIPFTDRDRISWLCYINRSEAECVSEVYQGTALLQTNPEPAYIEGEGMVSTYRVNPTVYPEHYFQAWFNKKNLIADMPFNFTVRCNDGYSTLVYSDIVTPTYKSMVGTAYYFEWAKQNMALIVFIFIACLFIILIVRMAVGRR